MIVELNNIYRLLLILCLIALLGCASTSPQDNRPENITEEPRIADQIITEDPVSEDCGMEQGDQLPETPENYVLASIDLENNNEETPPEQQEPEQSEQIEPMIENSSEIEPLPKNMEIENSSDFGSPPKHIKIEEDDPEQDTAEIVQISTQELLDSALDYCQASNDFWEQGDLDNAIDALDKAYSLILKVNGETNPELLQQREDLRFTISKRIIEVYSSRFTVASGSYKAIPLELNDQVEKALSLFKGRERQFFLDSYRRSGRYRPKIVRALKEAGLPEELSWLPLIESGFKVRALSSARALGMWQFIASTGYKYGLKRDTWIDERMDPEKSTLAAIKFLSELHNIFGDWTTALAAYNCGERRVLNRIKSQQINYLDNFWDLYHKLPRETAFYVPKFLAVLHIVNDPEAHGFILPEPDRELDSEEVTINKQVHLKEVASRLETDYAILKDMNPELRQNLTPSRPYSIKVPVGKGEILIAKIKDIPIYRPPVPPYVVHRVRYGESLSVIAEKYHTSVTAIMNMNGLSRRNYVKVGWRLKIPTKKGYIQSSSAAGVYKGSTSNYIVRKGDSLWKIAERYQTTVMAIRTLNNLHSSELQIGQVLKIPSVQTVTLSGNTKTYTVRRGDSPYLIAKRYRMDLHDFLQMNNLTPKSKIYPGQLVLVSTKE